MFYWWKHRPSPTPLVTCLSFFFTLFLSFTLVRTEIIGQWNILREKGGFLLHCLHTGVCTWLCNINLVCKNWHSMGKWDFAMIFGICFKIMNMSSRNVWAFERNVWFTCRLFLSYFTEKKTRVSYKLIHPSHFVRG